MNGVREVRGMRIARGRQPGLLSVRARVVAVALLLIFGLRVGARPVGATAAFPVQMVDATGTRVSLAAAPQRVVTLAPSLTEMVYAIGLGPRLIAVSAYSDYPEAAKSKPVVGDAFSINYEKLLAFRPDLVLADQTLQPQAVTRLRQLGVPVFVVSPKTIPEVLETLLQLGRLTGNDRQAQELVASLRRRIEAITSWTRQLPAGKRPKVYVEIWNNPLMTAGPGSFLDQLIDWAGGVNIAANTGQAWPQISPELVLAANPDVILLTVKDKPEVLSRAGWSSLAAIRQGRVYELVPDTFVRTGPRLVDALEQLFSMLHPGEARTLDQAAQGSGPAS